MEETYTTFQEEFDALANEGMEDNNTYAAEFAQFAAIEDEPENEPEDLKNEPIEPEGVEQPEEQPEAKEEEPDWRKLYEDQQTKQQDLEEKMQVLYGQFTQQRQQPQQPPQQQYQSSEEEDYVMTRSEFNQAMAPYVNALNQLGNTQVQSAADRERERARGAIAELKAEFANSEVKFEDVFEDKHIFGAVENQIRNRQVGVDWKSHLTTAYNAKAAAKYREMYNNLKSSNQQKQKAVSKKAAKVPPSTGAQPRRQPRQEPEPWENGYKSASSGFMEDLEALTNS